MNNLSPAAGLISEVAYSFVFDGYGSCSIAAAILRAAADQVVPIERHPPNGYEDCCQYSDVQTHAGIRAELLAIADELEA